ncbi:Hypothetical predicted protein, partial [Mytilus galloprovincialis]
DGKATLGRNVRSILSIMIGVTLIVALIIVYTTVLCLKNDELLNYANKNVLRENVQLRSILNEKVIPQNIK